MSKSINFLFGVHNHQPVGNFEGVFNRASHDCYRPFVETLYNFPQIKANIHFSGSLIDWLIKNEPIVLQKVKQMVQRKQVEILSGAYYEPVLPIIPQRDRLGQIRMLNSFIRDYFNYQPQGCWIGERVWDPDLISSLVESGIKYILLDDFHFRYAGLKEKNLLGYYYTEKEAQKLAVFPIVKRLRYIIPFSAPHQPIDYLRSLATPQGDLAATIVDDGEKFGLWPGTHQWVYKKKWLEKFFHLLVKNKDWLKTMTISGYISEYPALGSSYFPAASYEEMMSWSGGDFHNFFIKYPEANNMHQRMLYVSEKLSQAKEDNQEARRSLYKGQCNCPYWHGVFGGIYLGHLRQSVYQNLITAQTLLEKKSSSSWVELEVLDFDKDGSDELIVKNPYLNVFIAPRLGGGIFEMDYRPKALNLTDGMTRRPEEYHQKIGRKRLKKFKLGDEIPFSIHDLLRSKEDGLEKFLIYDSYRRISLLDHFLPSGTTFEAFRDAQYEELGDFVDGEYSLKHRKDWHSISVILKRQGRVSYRGRAVPVSITKEVCLNDKAAQLDISYTLENLSAEPLEVIFAVEFNISLPASFSFKEQPNLWSFPLETVSASESGFERNYQQTVILPFWPFKLERIWQTKLTAVISAA
ncbi:MAG: DUF1926 domain-containing protein [Candidatus Omnitrophica bacterium]|nr:DUF1926 domain-containing protein [Candidatus Omnitrophota bacterium]